MPLQVSYKVINTPFHHPFTISKGTKTHQPALLVRLGFGNLSGYGEAPAISYYPIPVEKMVEDLEAGRRVLERFSLTDPERFWHFLHHLFPSNSFLVCALDMAGWDLFGKLKRQPLYHLWGLDAANIPLTDYTIGLDTHESMIAKMLAKPWPVYKIKMGQQGDIDMLKDLRSNTDAVFRVDANEGWTLEEALEKIPVLKTLGVEFVEQPLSKNDISGTKILFEKSDLPILADEACVAESDVAKCMGRFHGINIKLTKCGGITPARRMITEARKLGMKVLLGTMNETSVGSAAMAHLAPMVDYLDMDGPLLLKEDTADGLVIEQGKVVLTDRSGLGVSVHPF